jgi:hypothetical protein
MSERVVFRQFDLPVFQNKVYESSFAAVDAPRGDIELVQSPSSGLVSNHLFDPSKLVYDGTYENEQAHSSTFRAHLAEVLQIVLRHHEPGDVGIEIGCGKGRFLQMLTGAGADFIGFDPAYSGNDHRVQKRYFGDEAPAVRPDYVVLRHVLEHIARPWKFLEMLQSHCKDTTRIYIEVPSLDWIIANKAIYDIFYEHVNYFSLASLVPAFGEVHLSGTLFQGQYMYVVANLGSFTTPTSFDGPHYSSLDLEGALDALTLPLSRSTRQTFIWGAGAKGITVANLLLRRRLAVEALIDINPQKQGKFAGGSGLPIWSPAALTNSKAPAQVLVMNPNYLAEIKELAKVCDIHWITAT